MCVGEHFQENRIGINRIEWFTNIQFYSYSVKRCLDLRKARPTKLEYEEKKCKKHF